MSQTLEPKTKPRALSVLHAASYTGLSESYLRVLIERRTLPVVRVGRCIRLLVEDIDAFLLKHRQEAQ